MTLLSVMNIDGVELNSGILMVVAATDSVFMDDGSGVEMCSVSLVSV